jgi:hypothetical protein
MDDLVWDTDTDIVWQRSPDPRTLKFYDTANFCHVLKAGRRYGWRNFSIEEGATLLDETTLDKLPIGHPFLNVLSFYWSSSTNPVDPEAGTHGACVVDGDMTHASNQ